MNTPFIYADNAKQERNEAGHSRQFEVFEAFAKSEGAENGVELKFDRRRDETGNWFVEALDNHRNPSGISITRVKFWCMQSYARCLFVPPDILREFIEHSQLRLVLGLEGSWGYLVDGNKFEQWNHERTKVLWKK